ncbi:TyrR/PhhR family helix-turn-helix DNA-binding protein [Salinibius halmophilus]|uniref:TyrR/PhhR family helix-turn-helix DNA-binding protein n=1 Tax=Salinibius halmophilus TaxID=1853216 RepID=UPI000E675ACD|nr:TyrR/PhhR family helix-turn-helix DNA-binding protein [Salinibius halmophilus]
MRLQIVCDDRLGIAQEILGILVENDISLAGIELAPNTGMYLNFPTVEFEKLQTIMPRLRRTDGVHDVSIVPYMPIEQQQQALNTLVDALPEPVFSVDARGRITFANRSAANLLGTMVDALEGRSVRQYISGLEGEFEEIQSKSAAMVRFAGRQFLADVYTILLPSEKYGAEPDMPSGAVITLKSPERLGRQIQVLERGVTSLEWLSADGPLTRQLDRQARHLASQTIPLIILGEPGVGKREMGQAIHLYGFGADSKIERVHSSVLNNRGNLDMLTAPDGLLNKVGKGSLIIERVEMLSLNLQKQLAQLISANQYDDGVGVEPKPMQSRIMFNAEPLASGEKIADVMAPELWKLLSPALIDLPPLRQRPQDVVPLARFFLHRYAISRQRSVTLSEDASLMLRRYHWPGNLTELEQSMSMALSRCEGDLLKPEHFQFGEVEAVELPEDISTLPDAVRSFESSILRKLYPQYPSSRLLAKRLGLSHTAIANKLKEYGINRE